MKKLLLPILLFCTVALAQQAPNPPANAGEAFDRQFASLEKEFVPLVEAMPADKFDFAPTNGEFKGVRTFATQAKHVATVNYMVAAALLGEKPPVDTKSENGSDDLKTKDQIVKYVKDSFVYTHKALATVNDKNVMEMIDGPFGAKSSRLGLASIVTWHSFDHYGQMVVYLRMNGIVPPASRQQ
ncbi:MAG TPA: DinB family protein [Terriglobales bacterium]|nr:DinB family protein [Terriglobales bacterium]